MSAPTIAGAWPRLPSNTPAPNAYRIPQQRGSQPRPPRADLSTSRKGGFIGTEGSPIDKAIGLGARQPGPVPPAGDFAGDARPWRGLTRATAPHFSWSLSTNMTGRLSVCGAPPWTPHSWTPQLLGAPSTPFGAFPHDSPYDAPFRTKLATTMKTGVLADYRVLAGDRNSPAARTGAFTSGISPSGSPRRCTAPLVARQQRVSSAGAQREAWRSDLALSLARGAAPPVPHIPHPSAATRRGHGDEAGSVEGVMDPLESLESARWLLSTPDDGCLHPALHQLFAQCDGDRDGVLSAGEAGRAVAVLCSMLGMRTPPAAKLDAVIASCSAPGKRLYASSKGLAACAGAASEDSGPPPLVKLTPESFGLLVTFVLRAAIPHLEAAAEAVAKVSLRWKGAGRDEVRKASDAEAEDDVDEVSLAPTGTLRMIVLDSRGPTRAPGRSKQAGGGRLLCLVQCMRCGWRDTEARWVRGLGGALSQAVDGEQLQPPVVSCSMCGVRAIGEVAGFAW